MSPSVVLDIAPADCWQVTGSRNLLKCQSPSARALLLSWESGRWFTGPDNGRRFLPAALAAGSVLFMILQNICCASRQTRGYCCLLSKTIFNLILLKNSPKRELPGYTALGLNTSYIKLPSYLPQRCGIRAQLSATLCFYYRPLFLF